jgi:hypothetical protein
MRQCLENRTPCIRGQRKHNKGAGVTSVRSRMAEAANQDAIEQENPGPTVIVDLASLNRFHSQMCSSLVTSDAQLSTIA